MHARDIAYSSRVTISVISPAACEIVCYEGGSASAPRVDDARHHCVAISVNVYPHKLGSYTAFESSQTQLGTGHTSMDQLLPSKCVMGSMFFPHIYNVNPLE
jgi:hypothetical protein